MNNKSTTKKDLRNQWEPGDVPEITESAADPLAGARKQLMEQSREYCRQHPDLAVQYPPISDPADAPVNPYPEYQPGEEPKPQTVQFGTADAPKSCKHDDPFCPCQDGDICHYEGDNPMTLPIRKDGHSALQVKDGKLETFDPHVTADAPKQEPAVLPWMEAALIEVQRQTTSVAVEDIGHGVWWASVRWPRFAAKIIAAHAPAQSAAVEDKQRLDWLESNEAHLVSHREKLGDGYGIWWNVVKRNKSISGHPLGHVRGAIDAAIAAVRQQKGER